MLSPALIRLKGLQSGSRFYSARCFKSLLADIKSAGDRKDINAGLRLHQEAQPFLSNKYLGSTLIGMYSKCGDLDAATSVFKELPLKDSVVWNSMLIAYTSAGNHEKAIQLFREMDCTPDSYTLVAAVGMAAASSLGDKEETLREVLQLHARARELGLAYDYYFQCTLVDVYGKCGSGVLAAEVFYEIKKPLRKVAAWNSLFSALVASGDNARVLSLYKTMDVSEDMRSFVVVLKACGELMAVTQGNETHRKIRSKGLHFNSFTGAALVSFYSKSGLLREAELAFADIAHKDVAAWNSLLSAYALHGEAHQALAAFQKMINPNNVSFSCVLTACSHAGLVAEGRLVFERISKPTLEHYTGYIDLLMRAGRFKEGMDAFSEMPYEPDAAVYKAILGAARKWSNVEAGRLAFEKLVELDSRHAAPYIMMANIYSAAGLKVEEDAILKARKLNQAWKKPGRSWCAGAQGEPQEFVVGRASPDLLEKVRELSGASGEAEEDKYDDCGHSERLAVVSALASSKVGEVVRVVKNIRVCPSCHEATSRISKSQGRTVVIRDASRVHVFIDGVCSCKNYW